jgi:outer membrane protein assembly factor BamE (lipoprotein component of BamABCDE complex)
MFRNFFLTELVLVMLPMAIYLLQIQYPSSGVIQAFGPAKPFFYFLCFLEHVLPGIIIVLAVLFDCVEKSWSRTSGVVSSYIACLLALSVFTTVAPSAADACLRDRFSSNRWKNSLLVESSDPQRLYMVDDLMSRFQLEGKTQQEITDLIGKPQPTSYFHEYEYVYWLGPERGFISIDSEWLCLKFKNGVVSEARILRD